MKTEFSIKPPSRAWRNGGMISFQILKIKAVQNP